MHYVYKYMLSVIERVFFLEKIYKETCLFFAKFTFSAKMRHMENMFFRIYKEGRFCQKRSELDFRCESGRKGEYRYPCCIVVLRLR